MRRIRSLFSFIALGCLFLAFQGRASELSEYRTQAISELSRRSSCAALLRFETYSEETFARGGFNKRYRYYKSTNAETDKAHLTKFILPSLHEENRLMVVVSGVHTYIQYKGHRIDSRGHVGKEIRSFITPSRAISGDLAFVIHQLSDETKRTLDRMIETKEVTTALTCAAVTCNVLRDAAENVAGKHWSTSALVDALIGASTRGAPVEIISLNGKTPSEIGQGILLLEDKYKPNPWVVMGGLSLAVYLGSLVF